MHAQSNSVGFYLEDCFLNSVFNLAYKTATV